MRVAQSPVQFLRVQASFTMALLAIVEPVVDTELSSQLYRASCSCLAAVCYSSLLGEAYFDPACVSEDDMDAELSLCSYIPVLLPSLLASSTL